MSEPVVKVKQGELRGAVLKTVEGDSYISFKGIPYAAPPIGNLRFKDPLPPKPWNGLREALKEGSNCAQKDFISGEIGGKDDCLYLNVATTSLTGSRPVMVWIHGGGFMVGSGDYDLQSPDYLVNKDVVYVAINYRLGVLGFLNLGHEVASGNQGLKDQVAALKWVKENIEVFGGDPHNVTIFGESAGSASVHYLTISPLARGLFHKAIAQSGVAVNPWASKHDAVAMGYRLAAALGKETSDPIEAASFLRGILPQQLIEVQKNLLSPFEKLTLSFVFGPSIDDKCPEPFLPRSQMELAAQGIDVPCIIGYNSHEGILALMGIQDATYEAFDKHFEVAVPRELAVKAPGKVPAIAQEIRKLYFGDEKITKEQQDNYVQFFGDLHFVMGINQIIDYQKQKKTPTYLYRYSFRSATPLIKMMFKLDVEGTAHADELTALFHIPKIFGDKSLEPGSPDRTVMERLTRMWTDFAKTGNPTPKVDDLITESWLPVTSTAKNYLEISSDLQAGVDPGDEKWKAWQRIVAMADQ